ncbi:phenazine biosynthesis protein PhzF family [Enterobacterales bacterium CwR94]|nr:phenazine biosynthesis protein PhzF family [Enterobacterales bacterium CwR94]
MNPLPFKQVDVFTSHAFQGNPLAVIMDASQMSDAQMAAIARWTNLSETTFVLPATHADADYRVRIFTPGGELPFAGHPTLGTAHALLEAGLQPKTAGKLVQECALGLVTVRISADSQLAFAAPDASLQPFNDALLATAMNSDAIRGEACIVDMGIRWLVVPMESAAAVLAARADANDLARLQKHAQVNGVALFGAHDSGEIDYEFRALFVEAGVLVEDPVTGSANACLARWFAAQGQQRDYSVRQGTVLQRNGRVQVSYRDDGIWIGGNTVTVINGTLSA